MKTTKLLLAATLTLAAMSATVRAQPSRDGPGGFGGPAGGPPRGRESRMRRNDSKRALDRFMRGLGRLERSAAPLSRAQAQRLVALIRPWQSRPTMTQAQAKSLAASLNSVLSTQQKSVLNAKREDRRGARPDGMRGPRGNGGSSPRDGSGRPPRPGERGFDPQKMRAQRRQMRGFRETMNPFYPPSRYSQVKNLPARMQQGMARRYGQTQTLLNALSRRASGR